MSIDTAVSTATNSAVIDAIRAHHGQLADQLRERTTGVLASAAGGSCAVARDALHDWYRTELLPHVVAEERALYSAASELDATRLLIRGMFTEHRSLVSLIADLALATDAIEVATTAAAAQAVFTVHLGKENDLLLPALDQAGLDLAAILADMHEILGKTDASQPDDGGCGCGCSPELDVRELPHGQRHEIIFARLDGLVAGQSLVIVNDHDPKPLRYQASALWPDRFEWSYLQAGPQIWRVAITHAG